jgi:CRP/FNR family transcriptional regulator
LPISKEQLAYLLGTTPETLSRSLAKMVEDGLIAMEGKEITVRDELGLNGLASVCMPKE